MLLALLLKVSRQRKLHRPPDGTGKKLFVNHVAATECSFFPFLKSKSAVEYQHWSFRGKNSIMSCSFVGFGYKTVDACRLVSSFDQISS